MSQITWIQERDGKAWVFFQKLCHTIATILYRNRNALQYVPFTIWSLFSLLRLSAVMALILVHWWLSTEFPIDFWADSTKLLHKELCYWAKRHGRRITNLHDPLPFPIFTFYLENLSLTQFEELSISFFIKKKKY